MKNKRIAIIIIIIVLTIFLVLFGFANLKNDKKNEKYDYTNKIFSSLPGLDVETGASIYVFMKNGKTYHFISSYDEGSILRSTSGTWELKEDNKMYIKYDKAIFFDGGELVETDDINYFNVRRINYTLVKRNHPYDTYLNFIINSSNDGIYKDYLTINDNTHFPIYEFDNEEDLNKKLKEMYGDVYTMLVDDSIEIIDDVVNDTTIDEENI